MTIKVNDDKNFADDLRRRIKDNDGYCLCAIEKTDDTKCMCKEFLSGVDKGYCNCGLYRKE